MFASFKIRRVRLQWISALVAMTLVFAQLGVAAYACPHLGKSPGAGASAMAAQHEPSDQGRSAHPPLCHEHCKAQVGVDHVQVVGVPPAPPSGLLLLAVDTHRALLQVTYSEPDPARVNSPPCSILFCVFRN